MAAFLAPLLGSVGRVAVGQVAKSMLSSTLSSGLRKKETKVDPSKLLGVSEKPEVRFSATPSYGGFVGRTAPAIPNFADLKPITEEGVDQNKFKRKSNSKILPLLAKLVLSTERTTNNLRTIQNVMVETAKLDKEAQKKSLKDTRKSISQAKKMRRSALTSRMRSAKRRSRRRLSRPRMRRPKLPTGNPFLQASVIGLLGRNRGDDQRTDRPGYDGVGPVGQIQGTEEEIRIAAAIMTEGTGAQDQADILQVAANRLSTGAYGNSLTGVFAAPGQFAGVFKRGLDDYRAIRTPEQAAAWYGGNEKAALALLQKTLKNIKNRTLLQKARDDIGGALQFRGSPATVRAVNSDNDPRNNIEANAEGFIPGAFYRGEGGNQFLIDPVKDKNRMIKGPADTGALFPDVEDFKAKPQFNMDDYMKSLPPGVRDDMLQRSGGNQSMVLPITLPGGNNQRPPIPESPKMASTVMISPEHPNKTPEYLYAMSEAIG